MTAARTFKFSFDERSSIHPSDPFTTKPTSAKAAICSPCGTSERREQDPFDRFDDDERP